MSEATSAGAAKTNGAGPPISGQKRQFSDDFKRSIIARVKKGEAAAELAAELAIAPSVIRRWFREGVAKPKSVKGLPKGVTLTAKGRKVYSEEFRRAAVKRMAKGNLDALASELKIHTSMLYTWAKNFGVRAAGPRGANKSLPRYTDEAKRRALLRLSDGESAKDVSAATGIKPSALYYWAEQARKGHSAGVPQREAPAAAGASGVKAAISFLKHARTEMHEALRKGEIKEFDQAHLLSQLALNALLKSA